jgi:hydroxymethylpyrimidine pyrophosphatase-like HAD family hydrolase
MPIVFFSDIDDTLIQSKKKCLDEPKLTARAVDLQGKSSSYSTQQQQLLIDMCNEHIFIPVTGRNKAATDRVNLNNSSFQVIDHGAIILNSQGELDLGWSKILQAQAAQWQVILEKYLQEIKQCVASKQLAVRSKMITDFGYACYVSVKGSEESLSQLLPITERFAKQGENARVHFNATNMALLPPFACKKRAVLYLKEHFLALDSATLFIGLGDSNSDLDFMHTCHFQMIPQHSQISREKLQ